MRFAGPMQSWGTRSRFDLRDTELAPSKSGVVGLLAAALGRGRTESLADLAALRLGVRADRPGTLMRDYHTAKDVIKADGSGLQDTALSVRAYLADAVFLVGVEGEDKEFLQRLDKALDSPKWPLALGRRSFPPSSSVRLTPPQDSQPLLEAPLEEALTGYPSLVVHKEPQDKVRYFIEHANGEQSWFDQPLDNFSRRSFGLRKVKVVSATWGESWF